MLKDLGTITMRCSSCSDTQQIKLRNFEPQLTKCCSCSVFLTVFPSLKEKPNNFLISLVVMTVDYDAGDLPAVKSPKSVALVVST